MPEHLKLQVQIMPRSGATTTDEWRMDTVAVAHILLLESGIVAIW